MGIGIVLLLIVGGLLSVQAAANVQLSRALLSPSGAAALQLAIASVLLVGATMAVGAPGTFGMLPGVPAWHLLGGLGSAVYITAGILLFPRLGAVVTVGLFIAGQMLASLAIDGWGLLGVPRTALGGAALVGVLAVLAGTAVIVHSQGSVPVAAGIRRAAGSGGSCGPDAGTAAGAAGTGRPLGWLAFAVLGGAVLPVQGAINAQLRSDLGGPLPVATVSFVVATAVLAVPLAAAVWLRRASAPTWTGLRGVPWWGWLGGVIGASYVTSVFLLIPEIGAAATIALTVAGQQLAGVAVDHNGLLRLPRRPVGRARLLGVAVLLAGVVLLQL
jgi:bacterial/archaeal transporter family-2 protein